tara:strand:+ start:1407 stop:2198 length:792 start_codon:yes stop_codon:yes gene_type:complete
MKIVTCCSRSGSSFICQLLHEIGADFGDEKNLVNPDKWNKKGYFENRSVNTLNHELLFGPWSSSKLWVDTMWPRNPITRIRKLSTLALAPIISRKSFISRRSQKKQKSLESLAKELNGKVIKDPRFCYLMNAWEKTKEIESALFVLRHPWESCRSMSKQTGLPLALTYLGWKDSILSFFENDHEFPIKIVSYDSFFEEDKNLESMKILFDFLEIDFDKHKAKETLNRSIDPKMRNYSAREKALPKSINQLYQKILDGHYTKTI